jgi:glycosyltransferase 2 family protein
VNGIAHRLARSRWLRLVIALTVFAGVVVALWLGPDWNAVGDAFQGVYWAWVAAAVAINLASVVARSIGWKLVIDQALEPPSPRYWDVFSAFCVGLLANAVLPGRIGELARVAVLQRRMPGRKGAWATLAGTVFAHRMFDIVPIVLLILYVGATAKIPAWAYSTLVAVVSVGATLFILAVMAARRPHSGHLDGAAGTGKRVVAMARQGLAVMHRPLAALGAICFQSLGWLCQLFAVYATMRAFEINEGLPAAALVLLVMNVATIIPLWPGNVGAVQVAIAIPLVSYGVAYANGIAFGFGLQAIEASVGVGLGLAFLAREGLSFASLRRMPSAVDAELSEEAEEGDPRASEVERARARVPG